MIRIILFFLLFVTSHLYSNTERTLYVGKNSTEALMTFNNQVEFQSEDDVVTVLSNKEQARDIIEAQLNHLFGPMSVDKYKAVPKGNHKITNIKITSRKGVKDIYIASYHYEGTIVLENGPVKEYDIILPINPETIFNANCTDEHYNTAGDFWYFWNPRQHGCPLKEGIDYAIIKTKIKRLKNTVTTYPEYKRLPDADKNILIYMFLGMDNPSKNRNPLQSNDINASNYRDIRQSLLRSGFKGFEWTENKIRSITEQLSDEEIPFVEEFTKQNRLAKLTLRLFFGPTGINEDSRAFHYFYKEALENAAVMIYDGHSGLGGHLDIKSIEQNENITINPNKNRYQLYYFNSCSSYPYYNTMYFKPKRTEEDPEGTKNLDILTNGLQTYFSVMHQTNMALINAIDAWSKGKATLSYQALAKTIDSDNLFGFNGDEDNPTSPK